MKRVKWKRRVTILGPCRGDVGTHHFRHLPDMSANGTLVAGIVSAMCSCLLLVAIKIGRQQHAVP